MTKRWLTGAVVVLVCAWIGLVRYVDRAMHQPPEVFGHVMAKMPAPVYFLFPFETMWTNARKGSLKVGDRAPDFTLQKLHTNVPVQLASLWAAKPVVLVFGSYT
ncbi:MAG TPA: hypothetical protein VFN53_11250 [Acidobacteriaceae bacterium]|nr:hypothetical protein [Acidobacteriaceae bacterium]